MYDVIIVGGGPAGSSAARLLSGRGYHCLVLDKATSPRDKPCGGAISGFTLSKFPYIKNILGAPSRGGLLYYGSPAIALEETRDEIFAHYVRRVDFDKALLDLARQKGAEVREGVRVTKVDVFDDKVTVHASSGEVFEGKFLIGADGVHSVVRRSCGLDRDWKEQNLVLVFVREVEMDPELIKRYFTRRYITHLHQCFGGSSGYGWIFPNLHHVKIGFGETGAGVTPQTVLKHYRAFVQHSQRKKLIPPLPEFSKHPLAWHVPMGGPMKHFSLPRVLLAGDAAGFVNPLMGEGIPYAMWSGYIGAYYISQVLSGERELNELRNLYEKSCRGEFGRDLSMMAKLQVPLFKNLQIFFKLARFDKELSEVAEDMMVKGFNPRAALPRMFKRLMIGILHGNLWK